MMHCRYELVFKASCPEDEDTEDEYHLEVVSAGMLRVEFILEQIGEATTYPAYQERITKDLAERLAATVITCGSHSGVETRCEVIPDTTKFDADQSANTWSTGVAR